MIKYKECIYGMIEGWKSVGKCEIWIEMIERCVEEWAICGREWEEDLILNESYR
jgi:hypothetical protein